MADDRDRVLLVFISANTITCEIEQQLGEMSAAQHGYTLGAMIDFWALQEDRDHPRDDGRTWTDVVREQTEIIKAEQRRAGGSQ